MGDEQLVALQQQAIAKVTPLIGGPQNVDVYKQYGGQWLDSLVPRPRPGAATPAAKSGPSPTPAPATPPTKS
jgi:hypothetical protein